MFGLLTKGVSLPAGVSKQPINPVSQQFYELVSISNSFNSNHNLSFIFKKFQVAELSGSGVIIMYHWLILHLSKIF